LGRKRGTVWGCFWIGVRKFRSSKNEDLPRCAEGFEQIQKEERGSAFWARFESPRSGLLVHVWDQSRHMLKTRYIRSKNQTPSESPSRYWQSKGGVGKTTLDLKPWRLVGFGRAKRVLVVDPTFKGTLSNWPFRQSLRRDRELPFEKWRMEPWKFKTTIRSRDLEFGEIGHVSRYRGQCRILCA